MIRTLRLRMMLAVSVLAIAAIVLVAVAARQRTHTEFRRFERLQESAASGGQDPTEIVSVTNSLRRSCCDPAALQRASGFLAHADILVLVDSGNHVVAKAGKPLDRTDKFEFLRRGEDIAVSTMWKTSGVGVPGISLRFHVSGVPIRTVDGTYVDLYVLPLPEELEGPGSLFLGSVDRSLLLATVFVSAIILLATWLLTKRIVGPVEELQRAARELAGGDLTRRVHVGGTDEIAELSRSFNAMSSELERQQKLRRDLVHDVVHELRTPLTALRCHLDLVSDGMAANPQAEIEGANEEIEHLTRLVGDLHELALAEARELRLVRSSERLAPIVASAVRSAGLDGDPRLQIQFGEDITLCADADRLRQILLNILTNAVRHTPADGQVSINARLVNGEAVIEIQNTGSTLTTEQEKRVFDRFYRVDPARGRSSGGTGLGLAIVRNLVEAHGGRVWIRSEDSAVIFGFALKAEAKDAARNQN